MFCPECGNKNNQEYKFCPNCGFDLSKIRSINGPKANEQSKKSLIPINFPSEIWNKLILRKEDFEFYIEHGCLDTLFGDEDEISKETDIAKQIIQKKLILSLDEVNQLKSSINDDFGFIVLEEGPENEVLYFGQIKDNKKSGFGAILKLIFNSNDEISYLISYSGSWFENEKNGFGIEINDYWHDPYFIGYWKDGKRHGEGIEFGPEKSKYIGGFVNDRYHGLGTNYYTTGSKCFEGEFINGRARKGIYYFIDPPNQIMCDGNYYENSIDESISGYGVEYNPKGEIIFEGEWYMNEYYTGRGKYTTESGDMYEGEFKEGQFHGQGKLVFESGAMYEGEFKEGQFHGHGIYTMISGDMYEGGFKEGAFHGQGKIIANSGAISEGEWENGKRISYNNGRLGDGAGIR